jgi:predicted TIM-barrel fold metal-dependent hydrolase
MGGFFHGEESIRVAEKYHNITLDTSSTPYPAIIKRAVDRIGSDRVVFATDNPAGDPISEVAKIKNLKFSNEVTEKIFYKNIARILKLNLEENGYDHRC